MARFQTIYSAAQKRAVVLAVLDQGLSARAATVAAAAGELGLPAFEMTLSTAQDLATRERRRRRELELARANPTEVARRLEGQVGELLLLIDAQVRKAKTRAGSSKADPGAIADQVGRIARAQREVLATARALSEPSRSNGHGKAPDTAGKTKRAPGLLERLAAAERAGSPGHGDV